MEGAEEPKTSVELILFCIRQSPCTSINCNCIRGCLCEVTLLCLVLKANKDANHWRDTQLIAGIGPDEQWIWSIEPHVKDRTISKHDSDYLVHVPDAFCQAAGSPGRVGRAPHGLLGFGSCRGCQVLCMSDVGHAGHVFVSVRAYHLGSPSCWFR